MPYKNYEELPKSVRDVLPQSAGSIFISAFNAEFEDSQDEEKSFQVAWGSVKRAGYVKGDDGVWIKTEKSLSENTFEVLKISDDDQIVYGWGMISSIDGEPYYDTDNDHISDDVVRKASTGFMLGQRISNDSHTENDVGLVVHSFPLTSEIAKAMGIPSRITGWMVGVKVDPKTLAKFKSGEYKGFSIEGLAGTEDVE